MNELIHRLGYQTEIVFCYELLNDIYVCQKDQIKVQLICLFILPCGVVGHPTSGVVSCSLTPDDLCCPKQKKKQRKHHALEE